MTTEQATVIKMLLNSYSVSAHRTKTIEYLEIAMDALEKLNQENQILREELMDARRKLERAEA